MNQKAKLFFVALSLAFYYNSFAQVGIGTVSPDTTSVLDITSSSKGFLAPRMTTNQRTTIANPAEGLLVFDTNLDAFYYYDTTADIWKKMVTDNQIRTNYVLVKSEADFPVPIDGVITLDENTLYELNGLITLSNSINLNNSTIIGHDIEEDVLNKSSGTLFVGHNGGEIKNITVSTPGAKVFNLNDTLHNEELILLTSKIINCDSIGIIKGYQLVSFFNIEYKSNNNGIVFDSITDLLLSNEEWLSTNGGTYQTFNGAFDVLEKEGGFSDVTTGNTAIDVSSDPAVHRGFMSGVVFEGTGTYINKYTTVTAPFNFTNDWFINCSSVPVESDFVTSGYYHMVNNSTVTNLSSNDTPVKIAGTTIADNLFRTTASDNRLNYVGHKVREFEIICTGTLNHSVNNARSYEFYVYKNGVQVPAISAERRFSKNDVGNFTLAGILALQPNDYIEIWVSINNVTNVPDCLVERLSVVLK